MGVRDINELFCSSSRGVPGCLEQADKVLTRPGLILRPQVTHTHTFKAIVRCVCVCLDCPEGQIPLTCGSFGKFISSAQAPEITLVLPGEPLQRFIYTVPHPAEYTHTSHAYSFKPEPFVCNFTID